MFRVCITPFDTTRNVGFAVGDEVEGTLVGAADEGCNDGDGVGSCVGTWVVGCGEGSNVGSNVGSWDGWKVGSRDGFRVGSCVGSNEGSGDFT